ncbi:MAG: hypothetical protein IT467_06775 [Dokdonella sp.]|uniref:hypothetical protein n=1 Tax=Dokdonella sp. TaxID=2291710 RepID=UPI0025BA27A1|nr:hypothetical protein [Dokdonella sp.]MBZ0223036.1 hypothetical protein [Dokdonella sp.]MCC7255622.1 hypothetical protein [Dokdonella sp.]
MNATWLLPTAILLGIYVLCAGCYGLVYALGRLRESRKVTRTAYGFYAMQGLTTLLLVALTPLAWGWKLFLVACFLVYAAIPPITWRQLERTHALEHES